MSKANSLCHLLQACPGCQEPFCFSEPFTMEPFAYDAQGRLDSATQTPGRTLRYGYAADRVSKIELWNGTTSIEHVQARTYTARGQLEYIYDGPMPYSGPQIAKYTYRPDGQITALNYGNGTNMSRTYDPTGQSPQLSMIQHTGVGSGGMLTSSQYTFDLAGNPVRITNESNNADTFTYDEINQIRKATLGALGGQIQSFAYDAMGNLDQRGSNTTATGYITTDYTSNALNQYTAIQNQSSPQHDLKGNMTFGRLGDVAGADSTLSYDAFNRVVRVQNASHRMDFTYDGLNRCVRRQIFSVPGLTPVEDRTLTYDGWHLYAESEASYGLLCMYFHGPGTDQLVSRKSLAGEAVIPTLYYHADALGSIKAVTWTNGALMAKYRYDAFGRPYAFDAGSTAISLDSWGNRFLFQGREWLNKVRLNDHRNRLYSPDLQRWVNRDPIGEEGGLNLLCFELNEPHRHKDPLGLSSESNSCSTSSDVGNYRKISAAYASKPSDEYSSAAKKLKSLINRLGGPVGSALAKASDGLAAIGSPNTATLFEVYLLTVYQYCVCDNGKVKWGTPKSTKKKILPRDGESGKGGMWDLNDPKEKREAQAEVDSAAGEWTLPD